MECVNFSETKAERKYYEDKKQKALKAIEQLTDIIDSHPNSKLSQRSRDSIAHIWDLVDDI